MRAKTRDRFLLQSANAVSGRAPRSGWSSLIVRLRGGGGALREADRQQIRLVGGYVYRHLPLIGSVAVRVPRRNVVRLAALPFVERLSSDAPVHKNDEFTVGTSGADTAYQTFGLTGAGVTVAVVDSGVRDGGDLMAAKPPAASRLLAQANFVPGVGETGDDACGHGTHVAGIVAGSGAGSSGPGYFRTFYGVARGANVVSVRVLNAQGQGAVSNVIGGLQWAVNNRAAYNIRVINLSLGHEVGESYTTDPLCLAVEQAWKAGIVVVCAAGNTGRLQPLAAPLAPNEGYGTAYGSILSPANSPYVITVGAMKPYGAAGRTDDRIATYSARGPSRLDHVLKPDLVAPGNGVISLNAPGSYLHNQYGATNLIPGQQFNAKFDTADGAKYLRLSGTSMAAPVVSGAAALLLQADPRLSPDTVKARLMFSAAKWTFPDGTADPCTFGAGYLDIPAALNSRVVATQYAMSPSLVRDPLGGVFLARDASFVSPLGIWGTGVSGTHIIWGHAGYQEDTEAMSSSPAVWGAGLWTDNAVWSVVNSKVDLSDVVIRGDAE